MKSRELVLPKNFVEQAINYLLSNPQLLLNIPDIRKEFSRMRFIEEKNVSTIDVEPTGNIKNTISHNLKGVDPAVTNWRPYGLMYPILALHQVKVNIKDVKVLIVGPRNEDETIWYITMGVSPENIVGLDLISYSEYIKIGDMHEMPFENNSFDVIVYSWVLGYSSSQRKALSEGARCLRSGGFLAIGEEVSSPSSKADLSYDLDGNEIVSAKEMANLLPPEIAWEVVFKTEPDHEEVNRVGHVCCVFRKATIVDI